MKDLLRRFIKDILQELTYVPKRQRVEPSRLPAGTLTTVLGLAACLVLFCATSFAWLSHDVDVSGQLDIAEYGITVTDSTENEVLTDYVCELAAGDKHTFTLTANGTASTGYCKIYINDVLQDPSKQLSPDHTLTLEITAATDSVVRFEPSWGTHPANVQSASLFSLLRFDRNEQSIYHSNTPHLVYEIPFGAKLEDIAAYYFPENAEKGVEYICIYNGIDKLPETGKELRIPFVTAHPDGKPYAPVLYPLGGYTVVEGDTLESVAAALGVTPEMLTAAGIKAESLVAGAVISVKAADDADSMEYYATGVTISIKAPDSDKTNHYYTSGSVVDGKPEFPDADQNDHYYTSGSVVDGKPEFPDADRNDHYYTFGSVVDGKSEFPDADRNDHYYTGSGVQDGEVTPAPDDNTDVDSPDSEEVSAVKSPAGDESSEDTYTGDDPNDDPTTENNPTTTGPAELYE